MQTSRRSFLKRSAAAALLTPCLLPSRVWSAEVKPNSRLTMGFIGMGIQSRGLLGGFLGNNVQVLAVCDVNTNRRNDAQQRVNRFYGHSEGKGGCAAGSDFQEIIHRKDIDAVCIATPDHWHAFITLAALRAGKDVYCEKPLTHNIHEAREVLGAVDANRRVLQTGSMQRSMKEFRIACELVLNGCIGKLQRVECSFEDPGIPCDLPAEQAEPGLDWDRWLGPAQVRPYSSVLSPRGLHRYYPHWRRYREFGGGMVTDWGAHHIDIAQWGLGMDGSGPVEILPPPKPGDKRGAKLVYANGVSVEHKVGFGVDFFGSQGEVQVNRGKFTFKQGNRMIADYADIKHGKTSCAAQVQKAERAFLQDAKIRLYVSKNHLADFLQAVKTRKKPIASEQVGARSAICCHLLNQVYYHGAKIRWDPANLEFVGGTGDPQWLTRDYRSPWRV